MAADLTTAEEASPNVLLGEGTGGGKAMGAGGLHDDGPEVRTQPPPPLRCHAWDTRVSAWLPAGAGGTGVARSCARVQAAAGGPGRCTGQGGAAHGLARTMAAVTGPRGCWRPGSAAGAVPRTLPTWGAGTGLRWGKGAPKGVTMKHESSGAKITGEEPCWDGRGTIPDRREERGSTEVGQTPPPRARGRETPAVTLSGADVHSGVPTQHRPQPPRTRN